MTQVVEYLGQNLEYLGKNLEFKGFDFKGTSQKFRLGDKRSAGCGLSP